MSVFQTDLSDVDPNFLFHQKALRWNMQQLTQLAVDGQFT